MSNSTFWATWSFYRAPIGALFLALGVCYLPQANVLRPIAGTALFALAGYSGAGALFEFRSMGFIERVGLSIAIGVSEVVFGGVLLNFLPWGLTLGAWATYLAIFPCIRLLVPNHYKTSQPSQPIWSRWFGSLSSLRLRLVPAGGFAFQGLMVFSALALSVVGTLEQVQTPYTQLWLIPGEGVDSGTVVIGLVSNEKEVLDFRVELHVEGQPVSRWLLASFEPGAKWETTWQVPDTGGERSRVEVSLFRLDRPESAARHVVLWYPPHTLP